MLAPRKANITSRGPYQSAKTILGLVMSAFVGPLLIALIDVNIASGVIPSRHGAVSLAADPLGFYFAAFCGLFVASMLTIGGVGFIVFYLLGRWTTGAKKRQ